MEDRVVYYKGGGTHAERAYCMKCRQYVLMSSPELVKLELTSKKGATRWALRGDCPHHGCSVYKIISKARAESLQG